MGDNVAFFLQFGTHIFPTLEYCYDNVLYASQYNATLKFLRPYESSERWLSKDKRLARILFFFFFGRLLFFLQFATLKENGRLRHQHIEQLSRELKVI